MKKLFLIVALSLTFTACAASQTTTAQPLEAPTLEPASAATPALSTTDFYKIDTLNGAFNSGTAYYEFTQKLTGCLLLKTDYATATQTICCALPNCAHDTDACSAYFPGRAPNYNVVGAGDVVYVYHLASNYTDQNWDDYWAETQARGFAYTTAFDDLTDDEIEAFYYGVWTEHTTPPCLYAVDPASGKTRTDLPQACNEYVMGYSDGVSLYGEIMGVFNTDATPACRIDLATGQTEKFDLLPTEHALAAYGDTLLTYRYVADAPLPADREQYLAAIQNAVVEIDRYDPRTDTRTKLIDRPYTLADYMDDGCFVGVYNGKLYFEEREVNTEGGYQRLALTAVDAAGSAETVWQPWPQEDWSLNKDGERYIWLLKNDYDAGCASYALLDTETGEILPVTQKIPDDPDPYGGTVVIRGKADDGRWLVLTAVDGYSRGVAYGTYGLIDADAFAQGSTDWQTVTMWQG